MSTDPGKKPAKPYVARYEASGRIANPPTDQEVQDAVAEIEKRWGVNMQTVLIMMHNHIFGTTTQAQAQAPTADAETIRRRRRKHRQQQHHHMNKNPQGLHAENPSTGG